jgi:hypothetical protein
MIPSDMATPTESLPDDLTSLKAMVLAGRAQNERLRQIIKELQRHRFIASGAAPRACRKISCCLRSKTSS